MSRFLFTTLPTNDLGLLTRSIPIADVLREQGHEIIFSSPGAAPTRLLNDVGFPNRKPMHPLYEISSEERSLAGIIRLLSSGSRTREYGGRVRFLRKLLQAVPRKYAPSTHEIWSMDHVCAISGLQSTNFVRANCEAMIDLAREVKPDAIVDFWNPFACVAARVCEIPLVTVIQADAHPVADGFIWWKNKPDSIPTAAPAFNTVLGEYNLPAITKLEDLNVGDLTLVVGSAETDPLPPDADVTYIGPILWQKKGETMPEWFDDLPEAKPVVWVYPGNPKYADRLAFGNSEVVISTCANVLADMDVTVVFSLGYQHLPEQYLPLPANFIQADYVPGLLMAERCDLMIHHGGYGSCQMGLYTGTPAVIIPTYSERESNARRVSGLGAGEFIVPISGRSGESIVDDGQFRKKVEMVLADVSYREHAKRCAVLLRNAGNVNNTALLIRKFIDERRST